MLYGCVNFKNAMKLFSFFFLTWQVHVCSGDGLVYRTKSFERSRQIPDIYKTTPDLIESNGYIAEAHEVTTEDGYILLLFRIVPMSQNEIEMNWEKVPNKPVVLIEHGILASSDLWLLLGKKSLPLILADIGLDVWIGNGRGNRYSNRHITRLKSDPAFWEYSHHEIGYYDLSASIDYALTKTKQPNLFVIGHSRGTTATFVLLSTRPEYNEKVRLFIAYAPVVYLKHTKSPTLQAVFQNSSPKYIQRLSRKSRIFSLPNVDSSNVPLRNALCGQKLQKACLHTMFQISGFDPENLNQSVIPIIFTHYPDGGSVKEMVHYLQHAITDEFTWFDYGKRNNLKIYGNPSPPKYDLSQITAPVSFFYGENDYFTQIQDLKRLFGEIKNIEGIHKVPQKRFNHVDFTWGLNADDVLYQPTIRVIKTYL